MKNKLVNLVLIVLVLGLLVACASPAPAPVVEEPAPVVEKDVEEKNSLEKAIERGVLFVGFNFEPPHDFITADGEFTGLDIEIARYCANNIGIPEILGVQTPWDGLIPGLLARNYNIISAGMARRPARMEVVDFTDAIYRYGPNAMVPKGNPNGVQSWDEIVAKKLRVGSVLGSTDYKDCSETYNLGDLCKGYQEYPQMVSDLQAGRLDVIVQAELTQRRYFEEVKPTDLEFASPWDYPPSGESRIGMVFHPDDDELREAFNECVAEIKTNGVLAEILTKFGLTPNSIIEGKE